MAEIDDKVLMRYEIKPEADSEDKPVEGEEPKKYGWRRVGIMKKPAVVIKGMAFGSEEEQEMAFADDLKLRIAAPLCVPMVIPRKGIVAEEGEEEFNDGEPFEVEFTRENIEAMLVKFMADPTNLIDMFDYEHQYEVDFDKNKILPCYLLEIWIVGNNPMKDRSFSEFGIRVPAGTVFAVVQFTDAEVYRKLVSEGCTGLSVQGRFGLELQLGEEGVDTKQNYADVLVMDGEKVLMLKRRDDDEFEPSVWGFAGGKVEENESAQEAAARELMEETGLTYSEIQPLSVVDNEDGSTTSYFTVDFSDYDGELKLSDEHSEYGFFTMEEIKNLPVIMRQNERFEQLVSESINTKKDDQMKEGEKFKIGEDEYIIKDGKPVKVEAEAEAAAGEEAAADGKKEEPKEEAAAEVAAAAEAPTEAPAGGLDEAAVVALVQKTVAPMIEDAMKAVVEAVGKEEDAEAAGGTGGKDAEMAYGIDGSGGKGTYMDFLALPAASR